MNNNFKNKIPYILVMALYGTTGIIKRYVPYTSVFVSEARSVIGAAFLYCVIRLSGRKLDLPAIKKNLIKLLIVGVLLGFNWVAYFEACTYTTVAKATLCYYMAPVCFMLLTPVFFKDKLTPRKIVCAVIAIAGMVLVSGVASDSGGISARGLIMGLFAAAIYVTFLLISRTITDVPPFDKTFVQLFVAALVLVPYWLITEGDTMPEPSLVPILLTVLIGVLNTGIAYTVYFSSVVKLDSQTIAIFSYADPVVSILLSALVLQEPLGVTGILGSIMIIGSMVISEI